MLLLSPNHHTPTDHDYGCDNSNKFYRHKYETTNAFIDFIGEPVNSPMAKRVADGRGIYGVKLFDFNRPDGDHLVPDSEACIDPDLSSTTSTCTTSSDSNKTVAVFVLDVRTNKDPWPTGLGAYFSKDVVGDFLGEEQWQWFKGAITRSKATVNVIVNGLQVHSSLFPNPNFAENWKSFPSAQQQLFDTILSNTHSAPILISGDVHLTQLMRKDCMDRSNPFQTRPLFELTTSGMTHSWGGVGTPLIENPEEEYSLYDWMEGVVGATTMHALHRWCPWNSLMDSRNNNDPTVTSGGGIEGAKQGIQYSLERNFGELEFDWDKRSVTIRSLGENSQGPPLLAAQIGFDQLRGVKPLDSYHLSTLDFDVESKKPHTPVEGDWICIDHRGPTSALSEVLGLLQASTLVLTAFTFPIIVPMMIIFGLYVCKKQQGRNRMTDSHSTEANTTRETSKMPRLKRISSY